MMPPTSKPSLKRLKALLAAEGKCPCFHWRSRPPPGHMGLPWIWKVGRSASLPAEAQQTFRKTTPCSGHCALTSFVPLKFPGSLLLMLTCTFPFCYQICSGVGSFLNLVPSDPDPHTLACPWSGGGGFLWCDATSVIMFSYTQRETLQVSPHSLQEPFRSRECSLLITEEDPEI